MLGKSVNNQRYFWLKLAGHPRWVRFQCKWETLTLKSKWLLDWIVWTKWIEIWDDIRELAFFCAKDIPPACGPTHVQRMPTCMYFFYGIADQQNVVMVRSKGCEWPLLSSKTVGKNAKQVRMRASLWGWRAKDKLRCREPVVTVFRRLR